MQSPPEVVWSKHAVGRGEERFGDCTQLTFPDEIIQAVGRCKKPGETFKVAQAGVMYVCVVVSESRILVKTVHESKSHVNGCARGNNKLADNPHNRTQRSRMDRRTAEPRALSKRLCRELCHNFDKEAEIE